MKFDVFVSFRGSDTRRSFVSHLLLSLFKKEIRTFRCEEEIPENEPASSQRLQAIEDSRIAIVVISKKYTASISCLDELAKIIECKEKQSLEIIPVLYEVDPSDVVGQAGHLGEEHNDGEKVTRWRHALATSFQIYFEKYSYWEDEDSYSYIIDRIIFHVSDCLSKPSTPNSQAYPMTTIPTVSLFSLLYPISRVLVGIRVALGEMAGRLMDREKPIISLQPRPVKSYVYVDKDKYVTGNEWSHQFLPSSDFNTLVGMDRKMKTVETLLQNDGVGEIGIWGVNGVGKTALTRCVYQNISPQFQDHYYFMSDNEGSFHLGQDPICFLEDITRAALVPTSESESERLYQVVKAKLGHRKVLLVVDGLYYSGQVDNITKFARWFGPGSRLIFVTQQKDLLLQCGVRHLCEVEALRYDEALQLFSQFAFKQEHVPRDYHRLSLRAVLFTGRIPLALKVFGSFLRGKFINEWEFELCRLEASQDNCVARVSSYIADAFP